MLVILYVIITCDIFASQTLITVCLSLIYILPLWCLLSSTIYTINVRWIINYKQITMFIGSRLLDVSLMLNTTPISNHNMVLVLYDILHAHDMAL